VVLFASSLYAGGTTIALALPFVLGLLASFVACSDDGDVGAPCSEDADCADGLVCDEHDGQASCQEPHGHEGGEDTEHAETEAETEDTEHAETDHGMAEGSGSTGHESGSGETGHQHDESGSTGHATGTDSGTGG